MSPTSETSIDPARRGVLTGLLMLSTIMQTLDSTIANVALPHMQGSMSASQDQMTWVLTSYVVAAAIFTSLTGYLVGRFGRMRVFVTSIIGFTIASALCGAAQSLPEMVLFRVLQGFCGAPLIPISQAILMDINPKEKHGQAMAMWGMGVMIGPILGPSLGGYLTEYFNWRWVFYVNVPIGILCALGIAATLSESKLDKTRRFDTLGFALLSIAIASFQLMLDRGTTLDWFESLEVILEGVVAVTAFYMFVVHMLTTKHQPFLNLGIFKDMNFLVGIALSIAMGLFLFATMALLPTMLQSLLGYPIITTGILMMPRGVGTMIAMAVLGRIIGKVDPRFLIMLGFILTAVSMFQMAAFSLDVTSTQIALSGFVQGLGMGMIFVPLTTIAFTTMPAPWRTEASSTFNLIRSIAGSVGIAVMSSMFVRGSQVHHATLAEHVTPFSHPLQSLPPDAAWNLGASGGLAALNGEISQQAAMLSYINEFQLMAYVAIGAIPLLLLFKRPARAGQQKPGAATMHMD